MRIGVLLLPTDPWEVSVARARHVEALGYHHLWTYDHLTWRRYRDEAWFAAMPWLTGMAGATSTIRLGTMVASPNFRHPVTFAKEAMTLDQLSGGRLELGIGSGGTGFDASVLGGPALCAADRTARFVEFAEVLDTLLKSPDTSHRGRFYTVDEAKMIPGCVQRPRLPIAVAAAGPKGLSLAARVGDAWITYGAPDSSQWSPAEIEKEVRRQSEVLERECDKIGRDPATVRRYYLIGNTQERPLAGLEAFTDFAGRYAALGFTDLVFHDPRPGDPVWTDDPAIVDAIAERFLSTHS
jgi:alkanesulfonate monooxygenase SsuD/methylene tetrahydromethanopterin reductase-like flavin-dependent oxidoreductase (luciferase family)